MIPRMVSFSPLSYGQMLPKSGRSSFSVSSSFISNIGNAVSLQRVVTKMEKSYCMSSFSIGSSLGRTLKLSMMIRLSFFRFFRY